MVPDKRRNTQDEEKIEKRHEDDFNRIREKKEDRFIEVVDTHRPPPPDPDENEEA